MSQEKSAEDQRSSKLYFAYDPLEHSVELYEDRNDAINAAEAIIALARGLAFDQDRWPSWIGDVCMGKVEMVASEVPGDGDVNGGSDYQLSKPII